MMFWFSCGGALLKKLLFLYNPHAGKARLSEHVAEITQIFQNAGYLATVYATTGPGDAIARTAELAGDFDHMVCAGGDGTLSEVITGLLKGGHKIPLGYIPAGSTNDFSRTLHLPGNPLLAAETAVKGTPQLCDIGTFNRTHFVYVAAFGAFTSVSYATPQEVKNIFGHMAYIMEGIKSLTEITPYHMHILFDGQELDGHFVYGMVSNSTSVGGFRGMMSQDVILDDGLFEVMLVKVPKSIAELNGIIASLLSHTPNDNVVAFQARQLEFQSAADIPWTLDGEYGGSHCVTRISNECSAVTIMRNADEH